MLASGRRRCILERERAAVLLGDLLHHGEAEAGALVPLGGDVRLEQARAVLLRQADAVVDHLDGDAIGLRRDDGLDAALPVRIALQRRLARRLDRLAGVLHEVGDGTRDEAAIERHQQRLVGNAQLVIDLRVAFAEQHHRLLHRVAQIVRAHLGLGHARELGELVDHRLEVGHLPLDGHRQPVERLAVVRDVLGVLLAQPLGRKLYRRQRVLDLVGDAPGDVRPGRRALGHDEIGDVVEGDDRADVAAAGALARHHHGEGALLAADVERHLVLRAGLERVLVLLVEHGAERGYGVLQLLADEVALGDTQKVDGGAADERDAVLAVEADDAGRHARQHRLHEVAALDQLLVGGDERVALGLQFARHGVEGLRQAAQVALAALLGQLDHQVAGRDVLGGADETADGRHEASGEPQADPDGGQHGRHRDHQVHEAVGDLQTAARFAQAIELIDVLRRQPQMLDDLRADAAHHVEILAGIALELGHRADAIACWRPASAAPPGRSPPGPARSSAAPRTEAGCRRSSRSRARRRRR